MNLVNIDELLKFAQSEELYLALIHQINKDFSGVIDTAIPENSNPTQLKEVLVKNIEYLLLKDPAGFQNLLYRIDVSENKIKAISTNKTNEFVEVICYLILKREWQKVWFRNKL